MSSNDQGTTREESGPPEERTAGATAGHRPASAHSSHSSSGSSSKHVKCIGRYVLTGHSLGKGNFARVEAAVHTLTRAKVAIKIIETDKIKEEYVRKNLLREAQLMRRLRHPNVIRLYETMKTNNLYCLVTEIAEGGELLSFVRNDFKEKRLPEATTRPFIRQLTSALYYLHGNGIVHRDLKMENILLDKKKRYVKIVDFGLSNAQKAGALLQTHCGSPEYAAPELFIPGRQYGPEVDVWSLGVNMYAMLVGKLPFRSPRQGTKKRQKLLEQISAGITEHHEKEMEHLSTSAVDLICHLLQPDSSRRASLDDVMHHPWTTKDGAHQLIPYEYTPPDPITQNLVIELMQKVLGETPSQIKETVKRDRCDWLAAIYNLLMDQPEGRNVLQRMITADPIDKLVSSSDYQTTAEHLSLSQGYGHSQHSQEHNDTTGILNKPTFSIKHHRSSKDDDQQTHNKGEYDILSKTSERRKHPTVDHKTLGQLRNVHSALYQSSSANHTHHASGRRLNNELSPHHHVDMGGVTKRHTSHHHDEFYMGMGGLEPPPRPHSRMSAPEPLPIPFQKSMLNKSIYNYAPSSNEQSPSGSPPPSILTPDNILGNSPQENSPRTGKGLSPTITTSSSRRRSAGNLKPLMKKTLSASVDMHLEQGGGGATPWKGKNQIGPIRRMSYEAPPVGWSSQSQFSASQRSVPRNGPADIQSLMADPNQKFMLEPPSTPGMKSESMELKSELFAMKKGALGAPGSKTDMTTEVLKNDGTEQERGRSIYRSASAKNQPQQLSQIPEFTASAKHIGGGGGGGGGSEHVNGLRIDVPTHRELPSIKTVKGEKISPGTRKKTFSLFGALRIKTAGAGGGRSEDRTSLTMQGSNPPSSDVV